MKPSFFSGLGPLWFITFPDLWFSLFLVCSIARFALWLWGRATDQERRGATVVVYTMLSANLSDQVPRGPNLALTVTLTLNSN